MTRTGWATGPDDDAGRWHSFAGVEDAAAPLRSRCAAVTLPAGCADDLVPVPGGRACFECLMAATEHLLHVGRMGPAS